jgi:O-antigen/teichoic acid export membrane protein
MSRKRKAFLGFYADVAGMIIVQLLSLLAIRFYLNVITLSDYGYWVVITSVIGWLGLADFGIGFSISRFLIKAMNSSKGETDGNEINRIAATSMLMFIVISFVFLLIGLLLIPFVTHWFHIDQLFSLIIEQ